MSFCDGHRPTGTQFLGVCVIDVTEAEAAQWGPEMRLRFPKAKDDQPTKLMYVAMVRSHALGINPGGEVQHRMVLREFADLAMPNCPRNRLMQKPELEALNLI